MKPMDSILRFGWGPGAGNRILCAGLPDVLFADGHHIGWMNPDGVWRLHDGEARFFPVLNAVGVAGVGDTWTVLCGEPEAWEICRVDWRSSEIARQSIAARAVSVGAEWAVVDRGSHRSLLNVGQTALPRVPEGAREAHPRPWIGGAGITWIAENTVYRMGSDGRVRVAGSLPGRPKGWVVGPEGAAVFEMEHGILGLAPGGGLVPLAPLDVQTVRFDAGGGRIIAWNGEGVVEIDLRTAKMSTVQPGDLRPVGFAPDAVVLDESTGTLRTLSGARVATGFCPSASAIDGVQLYGPGGTAWDLQTGEPIWTHAPLCGEHLSVVGAYIVSVGSQIEVFDRQGVATHRFALPSEADTHGPVYDVIADPPGHFFLELEETALRVPVDGQGEPARFFLDALDTLIDLDQSVAGWRCDPELPAVVRVNGDGQTIASWPIAADAVLELGGRLWCWNDDGMLLALNPV
jgi:hypothetical protein